MVVAVVAVGVVKAAIDNVVDVVAVRHRFVSAAGAVDVAVLVLGVAAAAVGVGLTNRNRVFFHSAVFILMVKVAVVNVIDVVAVLDAGVAAARTVLVLVISVTGGFLFHSS